MGGQMSRVGTVERMPLWRVGPAMRRFFASRGVGLRSDSVFHFDGKIRTVELTDGRQVVAAPIITHDGTQHFLIDGHIFPEMDEAAAQRWREAIASKANGEAADANAIKPPEAPTMDAAQVAEPAPARTAARDRPPLDWSALATQEPPARRWAIRGWLGFGHVSLLVGPGGIGKALLAQQAASALALGHASFIDEIPGPLKVLMWACEDDHDELWRRQVAIAHWLDAGLDAFTENLHIVPRHGLDNTLVSTEYGRLLYSPLLEELREQAHDLHADVVILDNVAQLYGGNENDRHCVTAFQNVLGGTLTGRAIGLLAHPARSALSEFSGSSAWENCARTRLYLGAKLPDQKADPDEAPDDAVRYLARRKANYSARDWRRFQFRDGVLVPDAVEAMGGIVGEIRERNAERITLAGLRRLAELGVTATDGSTSPRYLPRLLVEYKLAEALNKAEIAAAMRRLILDGRLRRAQVGMNGSRHPVFGLEAPSA